MSRVDSIQRSVRHIAAAVIFFFSAAYVAAPAERSEPGSEPERGGETGGMHQVRELNGVLTTQDNSTLRLNIDLGSVRILPLEQGASPAIRYSARIETDARGGVGQQLLEHYALSGKTTPQGVEISGNLPQTPASGRNANGVQFWVHFDVWVPGGFNVDVSTGAGDIQTPDIGGTASLVTQGGNIVSGRIGTNFARRNSHVGATRLVAKLETQGGHVQVGDVAGDLKAFTAGGHINTGYILGEANLESGGGHIRAAGIGGKAELATEGGNITVGKAGKFVSVKTGGGQIDFGEVRGSVHAQTGGGGIRVMYVSGPMDVESSGGSICLTRVSGAVRAATGSGTITAWINPERSSEGHAEDQKWVSLPGASQLTSGDGDIVVFLPRNLAANIEAIVENGGMHRIEADPALALQVAKTVQNSGAVKAWTTLNGGGAVLRLKTTAGRIKLRYSDSETALWESMMRDQSARMERELSRNAIPAEMAAYFAPRTESTEATAPAAPIGMPPSWQPLPATPAIAPAAPAKLAPDPEGMLEGTWVERFELRLLGGVRLDGDDFWRRILRHPDVNYPEIARKAGIEGTVRLQVRLTQDGKIEVQKILEGDTVLADAAIAAMKQWRGKPLWMDGKPVDVISTVTFHFKLRDQN